MRARRRQLEAGPGVPRTGAEAEAMSDPVNRPENLEVMTRGDHAREHGLGTDVREIQRRDRP
jgi:hypothetical protein